MVLAWLALAWLAGIAAGEASTLTAGQWLVLASIALAGFLGLRSQRGYRLLFAVLVALCLGAGRLRAGLPPVGPGDVASFNDTGRSVAIEGIVIQPPDVRDQFTLLRLEARNLVAIESSTSHAVSGLVLVDAPRTGEWAYGDRVQAVGQLQTPPEWETSPTVTTWPDRESTAWSATLR